MIFLVALLGTFVGVATSPTLAYGEGKKATGTTGSFVVVANTLLFLASTLDTLLDDLIDPHKQCKGTKVTPQFSGFMAQTGKKS